MRTSRVARAAWIDPSQNESANARSKSLQSSSSASALTKELALSSSVEDAGSSVRAQEEPSMGSQLTPKIQTLLGDLQAQLPPHLPDTTTHINTIKIN